MARRSIGVTIAGQRYVLRSDAEERYVHGLATRVDERVRAVQRASPQVSLHQAAMLAALQLADELERERRRRIDLRGRLRERCRTLLLAIAREAKL